MALMAAAMGYEGGLLLLAVAGFVPIASYRSFDGVLCYLIFLVFASCLDNSSNVRFFYGAPVIFLWKLCARLQITPRFAAYPAAALT
jgi:hypothetical protein